MQNYFHYFTEIEEHFQRRRGTLLLLSTLDWALIESWREAGIPLEAVLRGINEAFDKYDARKARGRHRRINGLAYCTQEVLSAVEEMKEAATGTGDRDARAAMAERGFEPERIADYLGACAQAIRKSAEASPLEGTARRLEQLVDTMRSAKLDLEGLEAELSMMEEKMFAILLAATPDEELLAIRRQAADELAPYRSRMQAPQIRQIEQQFERKRLLEKRCLPRLSLFYMSQS